MAKKVAEHATAKELFAARGVGKKADKVRDALDVGGGQMVDVTMRVFGAISVAPDELHDKDIKPGAVDLYALCLLAVSSQTRKKITDFVEAAYQDKNLAIDAVPHVPHEIRSVAEVSFEKGIRTIPNGAPKKGNVTTAVEYEIISRGDVD